VISFSKACFRLAAVLGGLLLAFCVTSQPLAAGVITLQVTSEQANIREQPDISSRMLKQVVTGTILEAESKEGEWYKVRVDLDTGGTVIGYVHESLVRVVPGAPEQVGNQPPQENPRPQPSAQPAKEPATVKTPPREEPSETPATPMRVPAPPVRREERTPRQPGETEGPRRSVSAWYGGRYAVVGDLNDGAMGDAALAAAGFGIMTAPSVGSVHFGGFFGLEYRQPLVPGLEAAFGVEYFSAQRSTTVSLLTKPEVVNFLTTPRVSVVPLTLSLVFYPTSNLYIKTGLELCIARCQYLYRLEQGAQFQEWDGTADSLGIGYVLGGGLEWPLVGAVSALVEADYRSARIGSFNGQETYLQSGAADVVTKGPLVFFQESTSSGATASQVFVRTAIPSGAGVTQARNAELSLSGLSLRVGLKFAF
jgi:hypothetical protein